MIDESLEEARKLGSTVELALLVWKEYGKGERSTPAGSGREGEREGIAGFMKKIKCSPDAYIQMLLQATYFQLSDGKLPLTYEACMTRLFREGRTETVRSLTADTVAFVRAFLDPDASDLERLKLMHAASESHTHNYRSAMVGQGIDRHLFALYVVSRYLEQESPYLQKVIHSQWLLSTSQVILLFLSHQSSLLQQLPPLSRRRTSRRSSWTWRSTRS